MTTQVALRLPQSDGTLAQHRFEPARDWQRPTAPIRCRSAYAAAHVVADPLADNSPGTPARVDWDATMAFRHHLWSYGLGVAEAMDTAQRGMGMSWKATVELIQRTAAEARACGGKLACGVGTDHLTDQPVTLDDVVDAYAHQLEVVEGVGATPVLLASRHLARTATHGDEYAKVYGELLSQATRPVVLHWLGASFDPEMASYWGSPDLQTASETVLSIIGDHSDRIEGIKISTLDAAHEVTLRRALPPEVLLYTGDDFHYPELIRGDEHGVSHALLGIFDPIAPAASAALQALDAGDLATYDAILAPTLPLARHVFAAPTYYYKTGIVFLAWLAGHQEAFTMVGGLESARSVLHLVEAARLAGAAGLLPDPELAADRLRHYLAVVGVEA